MPAHPVGIGAPARKSPFAGDAVAAVDDNGLGNTRGRPPRDQRVGCPKDLACNFRVEKSGRLRARNCLCKTPGRTSCRCFVGDARLRPVPHAAAGFARRRRRRSRHLQSSRRGGRSGRCEIFRSFSVRPTAASIIGARAPAQQRWLQHVHHAEDRGGGAVLADYFAWPRMLRKGMIVLENHPQFHLKSWLHAAFGSHGEHDQRDALRQA
jgi:hypothetical protein